jgi:hypothetical protein
MSRVGHEPTRSLTFPGNTKPLKFADKITSAIPTGISGQYLFI